MKITDRNQAKMEVRRHREELAHATRLTLANGLVASIAHEINQHLSATRTNAEAALIGLQRKNKSSADLSNILSDIVASTQSASEVVDRIRTFLKKGTTQLAPLNINDAVNDAIKLIHSDLMARNIIAIKKLKTNLPDVLADRTQIQQVLLNLFVNASESIDESLSMRRRIVVSTSYTGGREIRVSVADSGKGVSREKLKTLFQPFVTSKANGLGIGLWISDVLVRAHGGKMGCSNQKGSGAVFHFSLPCRKEHCDKLTEGLHCR
jgi:two-component system sensor kinase FixL